MNKSYNIHNEKLHAYTNSYHTKYNKYYTKNPLQRYQEAIHNDHKKSLWKKRTLLITIIDIGIVLGLFLLLQFFLLPNAKHIDYKGMKFNAEGFIFNEKLFININIKNIQKTQDILWSTYPTQFTIDIINDDISIYSLSHEQTLSIEKKDIETIALSVELSKKILSHINTSHLMITIHTNDNTISFKADITT